MNDLEKTKNELIDELKKLRKKVKTQNPTPKQSQKQLTEKDKLNTDLIEMTSDWIWSVDKNGKFTFSNSKVKELLGFNLKDIIGKILVDLMTKEEAKQFKKIFKDIIKFQKPFRMIDNEYLHKNGKTKILETSGEPIFDVTGKFRGFIGISRDITELKQSEQELRFQEQQLRLIYDSIGDIIFYLKVEKGSQYKFISVNKAFLNSTGLTEEQVVGKSINQVIPEQSLQLVRSNCSKAIRGKKIVSWEETSQYPAGMKTGIVSITPVFDEKENCTHLIGSVHDITEQKLVEEAIKESEERYRGLSEAAFEAIFIFEKGICLEQNSTAEKMFGYTLSEAIGRLGTEWIVPEDREMVMNNMLSGYEEPYKTTALRKDGSTFPVEIQGRMMHYKGRTVRVTALRDITEHKKYEEKIQRLSRIFEESLNEIYLFHTETLKFEVVNKAAQLNLGYTMDELKELTPLDIITKKSFTELLTSLRKGKKDKIVFETVHKRKDQSLYNVEVHLQLLKYEEEELFVAIILDITERKKAEEILSFERDKFSFILNSLPIGVSVLDKDNKYTFINSISLEIDGYKGDIVNLLGKDVKSNHPKNSFNKIDKLIKDFKSGKKSFHIRESIKGKKTVQISYHALHNSKGKYTGLIRLVLDITEMKESEFKIRESQRRLISHLDNTPLGGIFWDIDFKVTDWNKSAEKIFGYKKEEALGKHANELIAPKEIQPQIDVAFQQLLTQTGGERNTNENITKGGKRILCDWYNVSVTDINGKVTGVASLVDDITERKKIEYELKKSEAKFKLLLEKLPNAVFLTKLDGKNTGEIIYANPAAAKQTGYEKSKLIGMNIINDFYVEKTTVKLKEKREIDLKKGKTLSFIEKKRRANGTIYITQTMITPIDYENEKNTLSVNTDITKQFEAQEKIKESEDKYRSLFENNSAGVYVSTMAGKILDCNEAFVNMLGYSSKEEILKTNAINFHQNKKEREIFLKKLKEKNELLNFESKPKKKDGSFIYTIENVQLIGDNIIQGTVADITERKNAEIALNATNEFNESLIETIPFGLDIVDMEGNVLFMNNLLKDAVGLENPEGKCWEIYKDNRKQCIECPLKIELELGETNICEAHNLFGGREYEITHTTMNYKNQKAILEIFRNITEERLADKKIRQLSRGVEQSPELIVITNVEGNIEYVNPKVIEVTGYTERELIGKNPKIFQSGQTPKETYKNLWETILQGKVWKGELLNKRKNGEFYWESEIISPIINEYGDIINFIGIKEDITEKKKMREDLIKAKEKAEEMSELKSNFLANMSHELRTPMVGILGFSKILKDNVTDKELKEFAELLYDSGSRLLGSLNLVLNLTKIEADRLVIEKTSVDVIAVIKRVIALFKSVADKKNLYLIFENENDKLIVETDERMLNQIINNLVSNAVKFTKIGGITVSANRVKNNRHIEIIVRDTGIGIHKDKQGLIWEEFRQASEGAARLYEGTGLGLTITNNFTKKLGGEIFLESDLGMGSTFTVRLPILSKTDSSVTPKPVLQNDKTKPGIKSVKQELPFILLVDDDNITRDVTVRFLKGLYKIDCVVDGTEGIEKATTKKYDIILMDINLKSKPGGVEVTRKIRELETHNETPIIAVTAYAMTGDREKYLQSGFTDYISKPFTKNDLIDLLKIYTPKK